MNTDDCKEILGDAALRALEVEGETLRGSTVTVRFIETDSGSHYAISLIGDHAKLADFLKTKNGEQRIDNQIRRLLDDPPAYTVSVSVVHESPSEVARLELEKVDPGKRDEQIKNLRKVLTDLRPEILDERLEPSEFHTIANSLADLLTEKDRAYGSAFDAAGEFLKLLFPNGVPPESSHDALTLVRMFDKMKRIATDKDAFGEDPYMDIAGYAILAVRRRDRNR